MYYANLVNKSRGQRGIYMKVGNVKWISMVMAIILTMTLVMGCAKTSEPAASSSAKSSSAKSNSDEKINLRFIWWGSQTRHDRTLEVVKLFEQQNPNVKITAEFTGGDEYFQRLATQAAGNNMPDIVQMDNAILAEYVERDLIRPLNEYIDSGVINTGDIEQSLLDGGYVNGKMYAMSIGTTSIAMAVDPAMYEKAGLEIPKPGYTWDDFVEQAYTLKEKLGKDVYVRGVSGPYEFKQAYLPQLGQSFYNKDGTGLGFDDQYLIDFLSMWKKLMDDGVVAGPQITSMIQGVEDEMIVHGKAPNHAAQQPRVAFTSNQFIALSKAANRPLDMTVYPMVSNAEKAQYVKPSQFLSISTNTKHPEMVAQFIDFFTNSLEANTILAAERGVPVSSKVRAHLYTTIDEASQKTFDYIEMVAPYSTGTLFNPPGDSAVMSIYDNVFETMAFKKITPEQAAERFRKEAEEVLKKNVK
jgi:multiple sugar transport system substrate-binding protein